jgi:hypothetical protein
MEFKCGTSLVVNTTGRCQHFFREWIRPGVADECERGKSFFAFLRITRANPGFRDQQNEATERQTGHGHAHQELIFYLVTILLLWCEIPGDFRP